ncbi:MAG: hypothetical protein K0S70_2628, partial [Microbacterium sp.]|nr:hypothetical protein [Microbacterium sp.]
MFADRKVWSVAAALCAIVLSASVAQTTSAAWTDDVVAAADASAGRWQVQTAPTPFEAGESGTTLGSPSWRFGSGNTAGFCGTVTVSSTSPTPAPWSIVIHLDQAPYWGASPAQLWVEGGLGTISASPAGASRAVVRGSAATSSVAISAQTPLTLSICTGTGRPAPVGDPSWYSVTS